ncbi:MAG: helix-turn-helix domain-containing protein [Treponema sp.]|jgi:AraC-like DNA-binding protein/ligand-binding sensor protein|nr:helix-turn-helix domain-containing protein [Treponema sp.]
MNRSYNNPVSFKERKIVSVYTRATGSNVQIFDNNFRPFGVDEKPGIEQSICLYCTGNGGDNCKGNDNCPGNNNCREMHIKAIQESGRSGRPHAYQCDLGLMFWTNSIYRDGEFSGALRGSGYLGDNIDRAEFAKKCNGIISPDEFIRRVSAFPLCDTEKIQSLAEMLLLCAEALSTGNENYHEMLRLRSEQQASLSVLIEKLKKKYPEGSMLPGYPLDKERQLIASLYRGDKKETEKILDELLAVLVFSNPNNFRYIQLRTLELAVLLVRAEVNSGSRIATEINVRHLKQIQEAKAIEELAGTLYSIVENITGQIASFQGLPHALAMRKAEAYIRENFTRKISLREIAKFAGLSAPYFSTIFKAEMGENLSKYVNRLRVEKASKMLLETDSPLSEISSACCFEDQSWFTKIFKAFTGISPGKYRNQGGNISFSA